MSSGLKLWNADIETIVKINKLKECTNPIALIRNQPTPDGILSYEIFGTSNQSRRETMAYIDLGGHYMFPNAAKSIGQYNRTLSEILYGTKRYTFDKKTGQFTKNDEDGESGPEFLYRCWPDIKITEKNTFTTKEIEKYFKKDRDKLFITKFLVMPAFFRDINKAEGRKMSMAKLNSFYNSIISYTQSLKAYTNMFSSMTYLTQGRVQELLVRLYDEIITIKVKGNPSKYGMLRKSVMSKNIDYSGLMVICAPDLTTNEPGEVMSKIGTVAIPLARAIAMFFPFMVHATKRYLDQHFIQNGKFVCINNGKLEYKEVVESYDENSITAMISRYINSPASRFDKFRSPLLSDGTRTYAAFTGRYYKDPEHQELRDMTVTDLLYVVAKEALADKHVYITRYPLENYNGQYPARFDISTTINTRPMRYGEKIYEHYPIIEGDPSNAFIEALCMSNSYLGTLGGDYDGDTISCKPIFTIEGNQDAEKRIQSKGYVLNIKGELMRNPDKDFILSAYVLTNTKAELKDANVSPPMYLI